MDGTTVTKIAKPVVGFAVGAGIGQIVRGIVADSVPTDNAYQKVTVYAGQTVVSMAASDVARLYTDAKIDALAAWISKTFAKNPKQ